MKLTAEQRNRLVALLVASAAGTILAAEKPELEFLTNQATASGEIDDAKLDAINSAHTQQPETDSDDSENGDSQEDNAEEDSEEDDEEDDSENGDSEDDDSEEEENTAADTGGFLSNAKAMFANSGKLQTQNASLRSQVGQLKASLAEVTAERDKFQSQLTGLKKERKDLEASLKEATSKEQSLTNRVTDELASVGQPEKDLPGTTSTDKPTQPGNEDELRVALKDCETEAERIALVRKFDELAEAASLN